MPIIELDEFTAFLNAQENKKGALLGIDNGSKNIGLAVSDLTRTIASPIYAVKKKKLPETAGEIFKAFDEKECIAIIMGHPLNMDGSKGPSAQAARAFARNLLTVRDVPLLMWDERLSTSVVQRQMIEADMTRAKRAEQVDSASASYVLQGVLDRIYGL